MRLAAVVVATFVAGVVFGHYAWTPSPAFEPGLESIGMAHEDAEHAAPWVCPMHPDVIAEQAGTCPICGMALVQARHEHVEPDAEDKGRPQVQIDAEVVHNLGVKTVAVERTALVRRIETPGFVQQIQPGKPRQVNAPLLARVVAVHGAPGDGIAKDAPLLVLESEALRAAQGAHLELLEQAEQADVVPLVPVDTGIDGEVDPALTLARSRQQLQRFGLSLGDIRALEHSREASSRLTLSAPYPATLTDLRVAVGDTITPETPLFELTPYPRATVLANAFQRDAAWIQTGQPVEVRLPHVSGESWPGVVNQGAVSIDPTSQNIGVRLSFAAPAHLLKSAMYVVATIYGETRQDALAVPREALIHSEAEERVVLALGKGRFKPVTVRTGIEANGLVEILEGLEEGDQVVTSAQFLIDSESSLQASFQRMY